MLSRHIQFGLAIIGLVFSTAIAWYEGSAILDNRWEWKYSTPFSQLLNGQILSNSDISQLDYFVYAVKFQPTFPLIMQLSGLYLFILIGYNTLKNKNKWFPYYLSFLGVVLFLVSYLILHSPTVGGRIFFTSSFLSGCLCTIYAVISYLQILNRYKTKITI
ncbi:YjdJ family protein [Bacillus sp. UNC41MFS5]|uniref:YjdJ family protein n=1 Tax=Bacillus sp. UNC41MFS5 TaxID=1449046 RepID=UPI00047B993D|nr:YjdJ family protein [Bacillus sp. UNC41MFS5]